MHAFHSSRRFVRVPFGLAAALVLFACSSSNGGTTGATVDGGVDGGGGAETPDSAIAPTPANDAGTDAPTTPTSGAYPTDHIGTQPRQGKTPGNRIANVSLQGYAAGSNTLGTVTLAAFYDPQSAAYDVIIIVAGTLWDPGTGNVLKAIKGSTKRIVTFAVAGEGTSVGVPATLADLALWRGVYPWPTMGLDSAFSVFGTYFAATAVPFMMFIDARTMEIDQASVGAITTTPEIDAAVTAITSRPPAY